MKLSEYKNEDALDLLADLIEPVSVLMTDDKLKKMVSEGAARIDVAKYLLKAHNKEIIAVLARLNGADVYDANIVEILKQVLDLINDPVLIDFFASQVRNWEGAISTPAMANTEETEKA
jgi:hypothetical protein